MPLSLRRQLSTQELRIGMAWHHGVTSVAWTRAVSWSISCLLRFAWRASELDLRVALLFNSSIGRSKRLMKIGKYYTIRAESVRGLS